MLHFFDFRMGNPAVQQPLFGTGRAIHGTMGREKLGRKKQAAEPSISVPEIKMLWACWQRKGRACRKIRTGCDNSCTCQGLHGPVYIHLFLATLAFLFHYENTNPLTPSPPIPSMACNVQRIVVVSFPEQRMIKAQKR